MQGFWSAVQRRAGQMDGQGGQPRFATVTSYDAGTGAAQVMLQPEGVLSGWLPVLSIAIGSGWGVHAPLVAGDQVYVVPHEGDANHGVVVGRVFSSAQRPPSASGADLVLRSSAGSSITLLTDGGVVLADQHGAVMELPGDGTVLLRDVAGSTVNLTNNGSVTVGGVLNVVGTLKVNGVTMIVP
jgi:phage baseplate assembly protein V